MNPKIKEALSCEYKKDEETERICTFIADFIKEYGYHLTYDNAVKVKCKFLFKGLKHNHKRIKENEIELYIDGSNFSRKTMTTFSKSFFIELLTKEGAHVTDSYICGAAYNILEIRFNRP